MQQLVLEESRIELIGRVLREPEDFTAWAESFCHNNNLSVQGIYLGADRSQLNFTYAGLDFVLFSESLCESSWIEGFHQAAKEKLDELYLHLAKDTLVHNEHM